MACEEKVTENDDIRGFIVNKETEHKGVFDKFN